MIPLVRIGRESPSILVINSRCSSGHVFFRFIEEYLIVFMAREHAAPRDENQEDGGNKPPSNQQI